MEEPSPSQLPQRAGAQLTPLSQAEFQRALDTLSSQIARLEKSALMQPQATAHARLDPQLRFLRRRLRSATKTLRLLGNGCFAIGGFILVAFLAALYNNQLTPLSTAVAVFGALFLGLSGLHFHSVADNSGSDL